MIGYYKENTFVAFLGTQINSRKHRWGSGPSRITTAARSLLGHYRKKPEKMRVLSTLVLIIALLSASVVLAAKHKGRKHQPFRNNGGYVRLSFLFPFSQKFPSPLL